MELEWSGRIDELLRAVEHRVGLICLALETDADLSWRLVRVAGCVDANRGNFAGLEIDLHADQRGVLNLGLHVIKCPQNLSPGSGDFLNPLTELPDLLDSSQFPAAHRVLAVVDALLVREVLHSVRHGNRKTAFCSDFVAPR